MLTREKTWISGNNVSVLDVKYDVMKIKRL